jgi:hypothetical protein
MSRMPKRRRFMAIVFDKNDDAISLHTFWLEPEGKSEYRATTSMSWFNAGFGNRPGADGRTIFFESKAQYDKLEELRRVRVEEAGEVFVDSRQEDFPETPAFTHESLWEFYAAIGYDYKNKRWITPSP